jgi:glycerol-3-phosphate dehydrogenase (NAD(P)+)
MFEKVTILGAGSWGMAVSQILSDNGANVTLWEFDPKTYEKIVESRRQEDKLPGFKLPDKISVTNSLDEALESYSLLVLAVPAQFLRSTLVKAAEKIPDGTAIVNLAKGIEIKTLKRMSEVIKEVLKDRQVSTSTLSGPSHAEEVVRRMPTTVVIAGQNDRQCEQLQELFSNSYFRVYKSADIIGVEMGGSLKNIIAIAAGIASGLGLGDNTLGALITRGLAEITRLGIIMGAKSETFAGLSGIGDLVTTCVSRHSRNRLVGERIGRGETLKDILSSMTMVAEGVETTRAGHDLSKLHEVEMPITREVYKVLFDNKSPGEAVWELMGRELKSEVWR